MKRLLVSLALIAVFVVVTATNAQFPGLLDASLWITRPVSTILVLGGVVWLYLSGMKTAALIAGLLSVYLLKTMWTTWPRSDDRRLHLEVGRDQARFDPTTSIDLQFANGTVVHDLPHLLVRPSFPEMLVFPPSSETQRDMNGD
jgi:hypothetical protein